MLYKIYWSEIILSINFPRGRGGRDVGRRIKLFRMDGRVMLYILF